jgi:hypothetical protein
MRRSNPGADRLHAGPPYHYSFEQGLLVKKSRTSDRRIRNGSCEKSLESAPAGKIFGAIQWTRLKCISAKGQASINGTKTARSGLSRRHFECSSAQSRRKLSSPEAATDHGKANKRITEYRPVRIF